YKTENRYKSRSEFDQAIVRAGINMRAETDEIRSVLSSPEFDTHYRALKGLGEAYLNRSYAKAMKLGDSAVAKQIMSRVESIREVINNTSWSGPSALTDKAVLQAHITRCERSKRIIYFLSGRDGSEIARVSPATFNKGTQRLMEKGFLY